MAIDSVKLLMWIQQDPYLSSAYHYIRLNMDNQEEALHYMYEIYVESTPILLNGFYEFVLNEQKS
ncbi:hypothetical protein [Alkalicoccobacillus murimartini]|uniref:Uncharacterized protein n=1 Tax=Alkalicoccobacillus murimartini TaxID=171685 RepID=A0ABT9YK29_9BACI|nr:hypothetical protein [Alkalicoccobacillus murimartini]MDQ0207958.1 hypothetical protein [Alkalicoccobacillus murimartini]